MLKVRLESQFIQLVRLYKHKGSWIFFDHLNDHSNDRISAYSIKQKAGIACSSLFSVTQLNVTLGVKPQRF